MPQWVRLSENILHLYIRRLFYHGRGFTWDNLAEIAGKSSGAVPKGKLAATAGIIAKMENFEFDVRVTVSSFKFVYTQANGLSKEIPVTGPRFNETVRKVLRGIRPGSRVTFEDIKAKMPDGELRRLGSIVLKAV